VSVVEFKKRGGKSRTFPRLLAGVLTVFVLVWGMTYVAGKGDATGRIGLRLVGGIMTAGAAAVMLLTAKSWAKFLCPALALISIKSLFAVFSGYPIAAPQVRISHESAFAYFFLTALLAALTYPFVDTLPTDQFEMVAVVIVAVGISAPIVLDPVIWPLGIAAVPVTVVQLRRLKAHRA